MKRNYFLPASILATMLIFTACNNNPDNPEPMPVDIPVVDTSIDTIDNIPVDGDTQNPDTTPPTTPITTTPTQPTSPTTPTTPTPSQPTSKTVTVNMVGYSYSPSVMNINVGDKVIWVNKDQVPHDVIANNGSFSSGLFNTNETFSFTFTTRGTFDYYCSIHSAMKGKIIVN